ncbi:unnamed protein product, partial [Polarella glacialis]
MTVTAKAAAAAALDRAEAAGRRAVSEIQRPGRRSASEGLLRPGQRDEQVWDPLGSSARVAKFLRASSELRGAGAGLRQRQSRAVEEHLASLDRQLEQVEQTRALIGAVCGGAIPPVRTSCASAEDSRKRLALPPSCSSGAGSGLPRRVVGTQSGHRSSAKSLAAPAAARLRLPPAQLQGER